MEWVKVVFVILSGTDGIDLSVRQWMGGLWDTGQWDDIGWEWYCNIGINVFIKQDQ